MEECTRQVMSGLADGVRLTSAGDWNLALGQWVSKQRRVTQHEQP